TTPTQRDPAPVVAELERRRRLCQRSRDEAFKLADTERQAYARLRELGGSDWQQLIPASGDRSSRVIPEPLPLVMVLAVVCGMFAAAMTSTPKPTISDARTAERAFGAPVLGKV
ncbi:MAG TPA: hypothetical protein VG713_14995, partial [Pirellulales bacterium]|nr:hypothetical protein [Pirellulales bacterium]